MAAQIVSTALPPHRSSPPVPPVIPVANPDFIHSFNRAVAPLDLSDGAIRLLELLLSYDLPDPKNGQERKGFVWPSRATLAAELNVSERTVTKRLSELRNAGIIEPLDAAEMAHLRRQGYNVPGPGRGSVWVVHYDQLPDFQFSEETGFQPEERGASTQGGRIVPPSPESGKDNTLNQHQEESKEAATSESGDDDELASLSSEPEPEPEPEISPF